MAIYKDPTAQILTALNTANNAVMTANDVYITAAAANTSVVGDPLYGKNSVAKVVGRPGDEHTGEAWFAYDRLDLGVVFANQLLNIPIGNPTTVHKAIPWINRKLSTSFTAADLEDLVLDTSVLPGTLVLKAKADSIGWIGTISFTFTNDGSKDLVVNDIYLDGVLTPSETTGKNQASIWGWDFDFSAYNTTLAALTPTTTPTAAQLATLAAMLTAVTDQTWVSDVAGAYSLLGATIVYVGKSPQYLINPLFSKVAVLKLSGNCTALV